MGTASSWEINDFSLVRGGLLYQLLLRAGLIKPGSLSVVRRSIFFALITWLPLLVLSVAQGLSLDTSLQVPFLKDIAAYSRFLVAVPLLIAAEVLIDSSVRATTSYFLHSGLVDAADLPDFKAATREVAKLRDAVLVEGCLLVIVYASTWMTVTWELNRPGSSWGAFMSGTAKQLTLAAWWYALVSLPIYQFLLYRWGCRFLIWSRFLWRLSRLNLQLVPTHTDLAGGLGFLGITQLAFGSISFAASAVLSGIFCRRVITQGVSIAAFKFQIVGFVILSVIVTLGPLLVFSDNLLKVKTRGLLKYGSLVSQHNQMFEQKWVRGQAPEGESLLGSPDVSSLADLGASFEAIKRMRILPFGLGTVIFLAIAAVVPLLPLFLITIPLEEIENVLLKILFGR